MERPEQIDSDTLAANYMELTADLAYARTFYPGSDTQRYLNHLIAGYHANINSHKSQRKTSLFSFWINDFPGLMAQERRTMLFVLCFFVLACMIGAFSARYDDSFVRLILGDAYVNRTLDNITAGKPMDIYNSSGEWDMFFRITINNIRVSFLAFVFGVFCSVGTLWVLLQNGIMLGSFQYLFYGKGLLLHSALSVWAHGTFEITSVIIAGGAGIIVGNSFLFPGTYKRLQSFQIGALKGIKIVIGLIPFFIIAGAIESFVTRHAEAYPFVGACVIVLSLIGVVGYFIIYPYKMRIKN